MPSWSTRLLSDYVLSTEDASLSGKLSFTIIDADVTISAIGTITFLIDTEGLQDLQYGTLSFTIFPEGASSLTNLKTRKDRLYNVTIK